jgi:hypothetical protein
MLDELRKVAIEIGASPDVQEGNPLLDLAPLLYYFTASPSNFLTILSISNRVHNTALSTPCL